jgi:hypothetical protein
MTQIITISYSFRVFDTIAPKLATLTDGADGPTNKVLRNANRFLPSP